MKSAHKPVPRREAIIKYVRAKAHREGIIFRDALTSVEDTASAYIPSLLPRPSQQSKWARKGKLHAERLAKVPDLDQPIFHNIDETPSEASIAPRRTDMTVPILKIARRAKGKGVAREFEVIRNVRNVIALPEEGEKAFLGDDDDDDDDDWERVCNEEKVDTRRSYSSVLRGNERTR